MYHIFSEYTPFLINKQTIHKAFTAKELHEALYNMGIKCSRTSVYERIKDEYNPIIAPLNSIPVAESATLYERREADVKKYELFILRPLHEMLSMIIQASYYREYEMGHRSVIPPLDLYEDLLDDHSLASVKKLYENINYSPRKRNALWINLHSHFTNFTDQKRSKIKNSTVTKPSMFKVAFFDAVVKEGSYSSREITMLTGIHYKNIPNVLKHSKFSKMSRRIKIEANSEWDALKIAGSKASYAHRLNDSEFIVQMKPQFTLKKESDLQIKSKSVFRRQQGRYNINNIKTISGMPAFQERFLVHGLKRAAMQYNGLNKDALKNDMLHITTLQGIVNYIQGVVNSRAK